MFVIFDKSKSKVVLMNSGSCFQDREVSEEQNQVQVDFQLLSLETVWS